MSPQLLSTLFYLGISLYPMLVPDSVVAAATVTAFLSPLLSPVVGRSSSIAWDICKDVVCGKGSCRVSTDSMPLYECVCNPGWKQAISDDLALRFLPCIIPNCTVDYSCAEAQAPAQSGTDLPFYSPCRWIDCGGGTCNETSPFSYGCICESGYGNLLNVSAFPCYRQCQLGMNCANLGISVSNTSSSPSIANNNSTSQGNSITRGRTRWLLILLISSIALLCQ